MADLQLHLILGNRNYSSWSMRPWLAMRRAGIPFTESTIWLDTETARAEKLAHSPAARVPILEADGLAIWDSLAICEFVAERFPDRGLWPAETRARARARSLCSEMHSSFVDLRRDLPLNCRARKPRRDRRPATQADIDRIVEIWTGTRAEFGAGGDFLFGGFSMADAFFAPVASRFVTYDVPVDGAAARYMRTLLDLPETADWLAATESEAAALPKTDAFEG